MNKCFTHCANIEKFISNVKGNWRNSIYITCSLCKFEKQGCCDDILVNFDANGNPAFITVTDANFIFATIIDKSECLSEISNVKCQCLFEMLIKKHTVEEKGCPFLQLARLPYYEGNLI